MRIVAFSDLHIHTHRFGAGVDPATGRHSRLQDCLNVLDVTAQACFDHDAAARVFCGDLFHVRGQIRPSWLNPALDHFRRFHGSHAYWDIMIPGNHDMEHRADGEHALEALKPIAGVKVFEGFGYDVLEINRPAGEILGIGWVQYAPDVKELKRRVDQVAAMKRTWAGPKPKHTLMMIHHGVDGVMPGIPDMGFTASCLPTDDFDVVLCGDYHNHKQLAPNAWMIGAPLHHTFGDAGQKRGYMVIDFEKRTAELVEVPGVPKFVTIDVKGGSTILLSSQEIGGNFVRVRCDDEAQLDTLAKQITDMGAKAVQAELVRDMVTAARSDVKLSMSTRDMFTTWLADQNHGRDVSRLTALNDAVMSEAGVA